MSTSWSEFWGLLDWLHPEYLLFIPVALGISALIEWRAHSDSRTVRLGPWRRWITRGLRGLIITLLSFALAGLCVVKNDETLSVLFCLDRSASMERARLEWALDWIREAFKTMDRDDRAGVLVFGSDSNIEVPLQEKPELLEPRALVGREYTNLAGALRLAQAYFPAGTRRKIVLLSDGRENIGDVLTEGAIARSNDIPISTVHCETAPAEGEVLVESVLAPERMEKGQPFAVRTTIVSGKRQSARLHLQRGSQHSQSLPVELQVGRNVFEIPQRLEDADFHVFKVSIESREDENPQNNVSWALTEVLGKRRILLIDRKPKSVKPLAQILEKAGFEVVLGGPSALPVTRAELARYDSVIVSDTPATVWSQEQLLAVESYVKDLGGGFAMIGGSESFGLGGYFKTPIERILPVKCDIRDKDDLPTMSLVFVIDRSGSMSKRSAGETHLELAKKGVRRTLDLLYKDDQMGIVGFDSGFDWVRPLSPLTTVSEAERALSGLQPGGGTDIFPALQAAQKTLSRSKTDLKHIVLLTDGHSNEGSYSVVLADCLRDKITLSTVGVGAGVDRDLLSWLAQRGQGRFFHAKDASELPRIFTKDTLTASRSLLIEKSFVPALLTETEWFRGLDEERPSLHGFVMTDARKEADVILSSTEGKEGKTDGPILVRWRTGLGKGLAWTSTFKEPWGRDWSEWDRFAKFWVKAVSWLCKDRGDERVSIDVRWERGRGLLTVETGAQKGFLDLQARVVAPPNSPEILPFKLTQLGPSRYQGSFPATKTGVYIASVGSLKGKRSLVLGRRGIVLSYPEEYRQLTSNLGLLERLSKLTGGSIFSLKTPPRNLFQRIGKAPRSSQDVWPWLVAIAAFLFVIDVGIRRIDPRSFSLRGPAKANIEQDEALFNQLMGRKKELQRKIERSRQSERRVAVVDVQSPEIEGKEPIVVEQAAPQKPEVVEEVSTKPENTPRPTAERKAVQAVEEEGDYTSRLLAAKKRARRERGQ